MRSLAIEFNDAAKLLGCRAWQTICRYAATVPDHYSFSLEQNLNCYQRKAGGRNHPYIFQLAYFVSGLDNPNDTIAHTEKITSILERANDSFERADENRDLFGFSLDHRWDPAANLTLYGRLNVNLDGIRQEVRSLKFNTRAEEDWRDLLRGALDMVRRCSDDLYTEVQASLSTCASFDCRGAISFTDIQAFGAAFISGSHVDSVTCLSERLVHEASHNFLNGILSAVPLFENNPRKLFETPLRPDPRTMFGLFHQMYVLVRLHQFRTSLSGAKVSHRKMLQSSAKMRAAIAAVRENYYLTPAGKKVFAEITSIGET